MRRKRYALNEDTGLFAEETAKVFGVSFELIPFKVAPAGPTPPAPEPNHIIDPMRIPPSVEMTPLTTPDGALAAYGPGEKPNLSLQAWRAQFREQQVAFRLAKEICRRWLNDNGTAAVPAQALFPKVASAARRFLAEKLVCKGGSQPCDVLHMGEYMQAAIDALFEAIRRGGAERRGGRHPPGRVRTRQLPWRNNAWPGSPCGVTRQPASRSHRDWSRSRSAVPPRRLAASGIPDARRD